MLQLLLECVLSEKEALEYKTKFETKNTLLITMVMEVQVFQYAQQLQNRLFHLWFVMEHFITVIIQLFWVQESQDYFQHYKQPRSDTKLLFMLIGCLKHIVQILRKCVQAKQHQVTGYPLIISLMMRKNMKIEVYNHSKNI